MKAKVNLFMVTLCAVFLTAGFFGVVKKVDNSAEWEISDTAMKAQDAEIKEAEKLRNAEVFCRATAGEAVPVFDADGEFNCKPRRTK